MDKRKIRRNLANIFYTLEEGVKAQLAVDWELLDEVVISLQFERVIQQRERIRYR